MVKKLGREDLTIKPRLEYWLQRTGLKQDQLAYLSGVSQVSISRFDSQEGYRMNTLVRLSRVFGCTIEELFEIEEPETVEVDIKSIGQTVQRAIRN